MEVLRVTEAEHSEVTAFVAALNGDPEHHVGYLGEEPSAAALELVDYGVLSTAVVARTPAGEITGFLGLETDVDLGRGWLFGPFVTAEPWQDVASLLFSELLTLAPAECTLLEMYFNRRNERCRAFAEAHGFEPYKDASLMRFTGDRLAGLPPGRGAPLEAAQEPWVIELHDRLFPNTYNPGPRMVAGLNELNRCFVAADGGRPAGYVYVEANPKLHSGNIEFVGVEPWARRRGIGAGLVSTALRWMLTQDGIDDTWLVVDATNPAAQRLYRRLGWDAVHEMRSMRLQRISRASRGRRTRSGPAR